MNPDQEAYQIDFIEAMPGFISIIDLNLRYLAVNRKLAELMNLDKESFKVTVQGYKENEKQPPKSSNKIKQLSTKSEIISSNLWKQRRQQW
ncbi:MAG: hypothetical protein PT116_24680 [Aphanizomenon gracile PMC638.10]|nr:hypothetical protein [Aphanizomenon gracile PMC638.10]